MAEKNKSANTNEEHLLIISEICRNIGKLISAIKWILIAYIGYKATIGISGKTTDANIVIKILASAPVKNTLFIGAALIGFSWAAIERWLRHKKTEYLTKRIQTLEQKIDPGRTSSNLASSGATHPRDKLL